MTHPHHSDMGRCAQCEARPSQRRRHVALPDRDRNHRSTGRRRMTRTFAIDLDVPAALWLTANGREHWREKARGDLTR